MEKEQLLDESPPLSVQTKTNNDRRVTAHLPLLRFTSIVTIFVALDSLLSISLWLAGGSSQYLEDSVEDFTILTSTFDLACMAAVRGVLLIACYYYLERHTLIAASSQKTTRQISSKRLALLCHVIALVLPLISIAYAAVKGGLIIANLNSVTASLHIAYKILCIVSVVTPVVEMLFATSSIYFMWRMVHVAKLRVLLNETADVKVKSNASLKRIAILAIPEYPILFLGVITLLISTACMSAFPYFFGKVIDLAVKNETLCRMIDEGLISPNASDLGHCTLGPMNREVLLLVAIFVVASLAAMIRNIAFTLAGERFVARLRRNLFGAIIRQEMGFFDMNRTGELTNRLASDTSVIQSAVTENVSILARQLLQIFISLGLMFWISAKLTAVLLAIVPVIAVGAVLYGRFLKNLKQRFQDKLALANNTAEESISNMRTVRAFSNEDKMKTLYDQDIDKSYSLGRKIAFLQGTFMGVVFPLIYGAATLVLWYGGVLVFQGELTPGILTSLMLYTLTLATSFAFLANVFGEFMKAVGASVRIFELLDRQSKVPDGHIACDNFSGEIEFRNVHFNYPSRPDESVLKGVTLNVSSGQVVALVGPSGGGKSTIVNLIEHFYNVSSGRILIGGINVDDLDPIWFRAHIGIVSQEPVLFACTIKENISFGRDTATQEEIEEAARQANAHEFISSFEEGYDTLVGERGIRLSGGQKQRIAIARALLLNPSLLLLDEATSALDAESEHLVQEAIDRAMKGRTVLVIAHRLSTVRDASKVIVIDKGVVSEQGTHEQLLAMDGVYKRLVLRQLQAAENKGADIL